MVSTAKSQFNPSHAYGPQGSNFAVFNIRVHIIDLTEAKTNEWFLYADDPNTAGSLCNKEQ